MVEMLWMRGVSPAATAGRRFGCGGCFPGSFDCRQKKRRDPVWQGTQPGRLTPKDAAGMFGMLQFFLSRCGTAPVRQRESRAKASSGWLPMGWQELCPHSPGVGEAGRRRSRRQGEPTPSPGTAQPGRDAKPRPWPTGVGKRRPERCGGGRVLRVKI